MIFSLILWNYFFPYLIIITILVNKKQKLKNRNSQLREKGNRARKVICLNTLEVFDCIKDAEAKYNASGISSCCRGVSKTSGYSEELQTRLSWMYYENYLNDKLKQKEES